jgi:hypothetical protein
MTQRERERERERERGRGERRERREREREYSTGTKALKKAHACMHGCLDVVTCFPDTGSLPTAHRVCKTRSFPA